MKRFTVLGHKVNICRDIEEWGRMFYGVPEDIDFSTLDNREELESECMGFAQPEDGEIWIYVPRDCRQNDLAETIAHELGHVIEFDGTGLPEEIRQEKKAEHYENFYKLVMQIRSKICGIILINNPQTTER
jgi:hypothetical protein